jgi:N-acyl-D-aspartate/D-glutamate deacylase
MAADLLIFDPERIQDEATFSEPMKYATGIDYVLVNGVPVIDEGEMVDGRPGRLLRR